MRISFSLPSFSSISRWSLSLLKAAPFISIAIGTIGLYETFRKRNVQNLHINESNLELLDRVKLVFWKGISTFGSFHLPSTLETMPASDAAKLSLSYLPLFHLTILASRKDVIPLLDMEKISRLVDKKGIELKQLIPFLSFDQALHVFTKIYSQDSKDLSFQAKREHLLCLSPENILKFSEQEYLITTKDGNQKNITVDLFKEILKGLNFSKGKEQEKELGMKIVEQATPAQLAYIVKNISPEQRNDLFTEIDPKRGYVLLGLQDREVIEILNKVDVNKINYWRRREVQSWDDNKILEIFNNNSIETKHMVPFFAFNQALPFFKNIYSEEAKVPLSKRRECLLCLTSDLFVQFSKESDKTTEGKNLFEKMLNDLDFTQDSHQQFVEKASIELLKLLIKNTTDEKQREALAKKIPANKGSTLLKDTTVVAVLQNIDSTILDKWQNPEKKEELKK